MSWGSGPIASTDGDNVDDNVDDDGDASDDDEDEDEDYGDGVEAQDGLDEERFPTGVRCFHCWISWLGASRLVD